MPEKKEVLAGSKSLGGDRECRKPLETLRGSLLVLKYVEEEKEESR